MSLWRQMTRGLRVLVDRAAADQDVSDEVEHYVDQTAAAMIARGIDPQEARRLARIEVGNVTVVRERVRAYGWENVVGTIAADLRYAARGLRAAPGFTVVSLLTLALGVGGTTAIFSAVYPILFEPLPYPNSDRIAMIWEARRDGSRNDGTFGMYRSLADRGRSFESIAVLKAWQPSITGRDQPERFEGQRVSASYFHVLGVAPSLGRDLQPNDDRAGGPSVVLLSDALWRRRFGADRNVIGRQVTLDGKNYTVVGVMPSTFENVLAPNAELWSPLQYDISQGVAWGHHLRTVARLGPGVGVEQAAREANVIAHEVIREQHPVTYGSNVELTATSLHDDVTRGVRPALLAILGAVVLVLAIACVNVTNLLLARGAQRRAEFALRAALGADRSRLIRQLLTESLLLAVLGAAAGLIVTVAGVRALIALSPPSLPRIGAIGINGPVFAFGLGITTLIGLAFGLIPALQASRHDPHSNLQGGSRRTVGGGHRVRNGLVVAEVALALVLLVGSGLLLRSLQHLFAVPSGFDSSRLLTMQVQSVGPRFVDDKTALRFFDQVADAVRTVPGVSAVALTSQLPLSGDRDEYGVRVGSSSEGSSVFRYAVSPAYIETMRIPLRRGRLLSQQDANNAPLAVLVNESFANRKFQGVDPIGQRLGIGPLEGYTIVGVVGDVKQASLAVGNPDAVYTTTSQWPFASRIMTLVVRARGDASALIPAVRQAVWTIDKDQPIVRVATMDDLVAASASERRFALVLFEAFAFAALVLAAAGIYGVLSGSVAERTREIGVRAALGATRASVVALVARQGMGLTSIGAAIGFIGALGASQAIVTMLFGVSRLDPTTYLAVVMILLVVSALACVVPAWRAARVDPAITLRAE